jgi:hypothetical protein
MMCRQVGHTCKVNARPVFQQKGQYFPLATSDMRRGFPLSSKRRAKTAVSGAA